MRSGRVSAFFAGKPQQLSESGAAQARQQLDPAPQPAVRPGRRMSIDMLLHPWRRTTDIKTADGHVEDCEARSAIDAAAVGITASVTGAHWLKVSNTSARRLTCVLLLRVLQDSLICLCK